MEITCPWCGEDADDTPEEIPFFEDVVEIECAECGRPVIIRRVMSAHYTSEKGEWEK